MWRSVALIVGLAGLLTGCGWGGGGVAATSHPRASSSSLSASRYRDGRFGWSLSIPAGFQRGHFRGGIRAFVDGEWVANFNLDVAASWSHRNESMSPGWQRLRAFPASGVALAVWYVRGGVGVPVGALSLPDTPLPVGVNNLAGVAPYVGGSEPLPRFGRVYHAGTAFQVAVWIGPAASRSDTRAMWGSLASLGFRRDSSHASS